MIICKKISLARVFNIVVPVFSFSHQSGIFPSTIATLSSVVGVPVRLTNESVPNSGLQPHDMRVLQLLRMICNGTLAANTGLPTVTYMYIPGEWALLR